MTTKTKSRNKTPKVHALGGRMALAPVLEKRLRGEGRASSFSYMKSPEKQHSFDVGDAVEVYCDHEKGGQRVRGWLKGVVVQVDNKMVAVQFRSNVFLTDGWMVPDRILWYPLTSDQIRPASNGQKSSRRATDR